MDSVNFKRQAQGPSVLLARCSAHSRQNRARMGALTWARARLTDVGMTIHKRFTATLNCFSRRYSLSAKNAAWPGPPGLALRPFPLRKLGSGFLARAQEAGATLTRP